MKNFILFLSIFILFVLCVNTAFIQPKVEKPATDKVKDAFVADLTTLTKLSRKMYADAKLYIKDSTNNKTLKNDFYKARAAYKTLEYLAEYYAPATCKFINGPFLYKTDEEEPSKAPRKPEGFQAIEDQLFAQDTIDRYELENLCFRLKNNIEKLYPMVTNYDFTDENIWLASRMEIVRIMAMGITGFDSPTCKNSLPEAQASLEGVKKIWLMYAIEDEKKKAVIDAFTAANNYLIKNKEFDKFDRLNFITDHLNPIYALGAKLQIELKIPFSNNANAIFQDAKSIFATSAWNPDFFRSNRLTANPNKQKQALIGKYLFFDPVISSNGKRSCASCHNPNNGFAEKLAKSKAMDGKSSIKRNAPTILNAALQASMFAEGRVNFLEEQINDVVFAPDELHSNFKDIAIRLQKSGEYKKLFAEAFDLGKDSTITAYAIIKSIAEYERTLIGFNSRFDQYMNGNKLAMNSAEIRGFNIFSGKGLCATCHFIPLFNGTVPPSYTEAELEVLGVLENPKSKTPKLDPDKGRGDFTSIPWQSGAFKTPTVRNIAFTAPYFHNGAYQTLEEVVDFYNKGGGKGFGLNLPNQTLPFDNLNLAKREQADLVAFMKTLSDTISLTSKPVKLPEVEGYTRLIGGEY